MNPLLQHFLAESRDLLEEGAAGLLRLERTPEDAEAITVAFRAFHTLKGGASLLELAEVVTVVHAAEDVLSAVRDGKSTITPDVCDTLLACVDAVSRWLEALGDEGEIPAGAAVEAAALRVRLGGRPMQADTHTAAPVKRLPERAVEDLPVALRTAARRRTASGQTLIHVRYRPDAGCFFRGDDPVLLVRETPGLILARAALPPSEGEVDPYASALGFELLSGADEAALEAHFRYVREEVELAELPAIRASGPEMSPTEAAFRRVVADQRRLLDLACEADEWPGRLAAAHRAITGAFAFIGRTDEVPAGGDVLRTFLDELLAQPPGAFAEDEPAPAYEPPTPQAMHAPQVEDHSKERRPVRQLKIDSDKIDAVLQLVGELTVAKNGLAYAAKRAELRGAPAEVVRDIRDQHDHVHRLTDELQHAAMQLRMIPVAAVFGRFPRLVRDLARKLGREVDLVVEGDDTGADKDLVDRLADPLVHMVRNALDHGIEPPDVREDAGKSRTGTLCLRARHEGDQLVIELEDDGAGIDPERVKRKAVERGLITAERAVTMSDADAVNLVFLPGFSTAEQISDVSGRGVGMDAVRATINGFGGDVSLTSRHGRGTLVRLTSPLTMAVTRVLVVRVGADSYGVPMDSVVAAVRAPTASIRRFGGGDGAAAMNWRGRIVPIIDMHEQRDRAQDEEAILVVRSLGHEIGLVVSAFAERVDVVMKPLPGMLAEVPGLLGTAILGAGNVLLVIDPKEVASWRNASASSTTLSC